MLGLQIPNIDAQALDQLTVALRGIWPGLTPPLVLHESPGGHANTQLHIVAADSTGACVGLKAANRIAHGTQREGIISQLASLLEMPLGPRQRIMLPIQNLPKIGGQDFVASHWHDGAEALDKLSNVPGGAAIKQAVAANPEPLLVDFGEWLGFGLVFGINDRSNAGNWICSAVGPSIGMIDTEDSLTAPAVLGDYKFPLSFWGLLQGVNGPVPGGALHNTQRSAVARGLRRFYKNWAGSHKTVLTQLNQSPISSSYRCNWMGLGHKEFMDQALAGLA